ncbi:MAG: Riboflavin biosynthesis protein RibBA [candidate division BRC1 bacterium ADurb.BinA364]|nr:MAG: Riboflavin biosynthesis protein RibBA [candidate division BRC1 bacterium ADurb.BinA364]
MKDEQNTLIGAEEAIARFQQGQTLILVDDENRENEGDFIVAAQFASPEAVNVMIRDGRGMLCVAISDDLARQLALPLMEQRNIAQTGANYTVSVDHIASGTGISAFDRSATIRAIADSDAKPDDFRRPGHVHPVVARPGGTLQRAGHTEGVLDLCRLAGLRPAGAMCEIVRDDGHMARLPDLEAVARRLDLRIVTIRDIIAYRLHKEKLVERVAETVLPNAHGLWRLCLYENKLNGDLHTAMVLGEPEKQDSALVRVHSQCFTGDTLGSYRCDCGPQLETAQKRIAEEGHGVLLYLQQEGRGIGLKAKLQAYMLQDSGHDTVEANKALGHAADPREYGIGAQILTDLGVRRMRVMTNNPRKLIGLKAFGLEIVDRVPLEVGQTEYNRFYMETKARKLDHMLSSVPPAAAAPEMDI